MKKLLFSIILLLLHITLNAQGKNRFWAEAGQKFTTYQLTGSEKNLIRVWPIQNFIIGYGYGRNIYKNISLETGLTYNKYGFDFTFFENPKRGGGNYHEFYAIQVPLRARFDFLIKKPNIGLGITAGHSINFLGRTGTFNPSSGIGLYNNGKDTVQSEELAFIERDFVGLTQIGLVIKKPIYKALGVEVRGILNIGYKDFFRSQIFYTVNKNMPYGYYGGYGTIKTNGSYRALTIGLTYSY